MTVFVHYLVRGAVALIGGLFLSQVSFAGTLSTDDFLGVSASEVEKVDALQQMAELWGNWKIIEEKLFPTSQAAASSNVVVASALAKDVQASPDGVEQTSLIGDIWSFHQDASFISRQQGLKKGEAHYTLKLPQLEISQPQSRRQFLVLSLGNDRMRLQEIRGSNGADPSTIREIELQRSEESAGQGPASIYYSPRQIATLQVLITCGRLDAVQLELLYPPRAKNDDDKATAAKEFPSLAPKNTPLDAATLEQRQVMDEYLFRHAGVKQFDWGVYQASKRYYEADSAYNAVFPGIIHRGIRRCLN